MKRAMAAVVLLAACGMADVEKKPTPSKAQGAFDKLKSLVGKWDGKRYDDAPVKLSYELISNGTCLLERLNSPDATEMVTVYHLDGDTILATHYCGAGNQPRMRCKPGGDARKEFDFSFVDVSNLSKPGAGHMEGLKLTLIDGDHLTQDWNWKEDGNSHVGKFRYERNKAVGK